MLLVAKERESTSCTDRITSKPKACNSTEIERAPNGLMHQTKENFSKNAESTKWFMLAAYDKIQE